ncbi:MAG TPA: limonene-1,2-epoxide hydrolase family protein [Allosphingosinicella sp.]|nr:limonene-1,2-epoxide hydrolase family protein [Allosphingosinicella sp.]
MSNTDTSAEAIVRRFCQTWDERDLEGIVAMLSLDIAYQNVPRPAMHGREEVRAFVAPIIAKATRIEFILTAIATSPDGETVLTERLDRLHYGDKVVDIPLMGVFVVKSGLITAWRDYADSAHVGAQFAQLAG